MSRTFHNSPWDQDGIRFWPPNAVCHVKPSTFYDYVKLPISWSCGWILERLAGRRVVNSGAQGEVIGEGLSHQPEVSIPLRSAPSLPSLFVGWIEELFWQDYNPEHSKLLFPNFVAHP